MASRLLSWLVLGLSVVNLGLAAPIPTESAGVLTSLLTERSTASPAGDTRPVRIGKAALQSRGISVKPIHFLDSTLGLTETSVDLDVVPVFSGARNKRVTADTNGDVLTVTYGGHRFVPVWARPWTSPRFRGALRFSQGLAIFILASSLGMALVCSYWRSLCPKQEHLEWLSLDYAEPGVIPKDGDLHHVQDGSYMLEEEGESAPGNACNGTRL